MKTFVLLIVSGVLGATVTFATIAATVQPLESQTSNGVSSELQPAEKVYNLQPTYNPQRQ